MSKPTKREVFVVGQRAYQSLEEAMHHQPGEWSETRRRAVKYVSADSVARLVEAARQALIEMDHHKSTFIKGAVYCVACEALRGEEDIEEHHQHCPVVTLHDALLEVAGDGDKAP